MIDPNDPPDPDRQLDAACPRCAESPAEGHYEEIRAIGQTDAVAEVFQGARCPRCGLWFVTPEAIEAAEVG